MCTFADCNAELAETDVRCIQCGRLRPHMASRDIVIKSRAELQQIYDQVLSHHGAVLPDSELLPEHSVVLINIRLPDGEGVIRVTGAVVGHADKPERAEAPYDIFFQLLDLDEDKQEIIQLIAAEPASAKPPEAVVAPEVLEVPDEPETMPLGKAVVARQGTNLTMIAYGAMMRPTLEAAEDLADSGEVNAEVIDLLTVSPIDTETITESVQKTGRAVVIHEGPRTCGIGAEVVARIVENCLMNLEAPIRRVTGYDVQFPYFAREQAFLPNADRISHAARDGMYF